MRLLVLLSFGLNFRHSLFLRFGSSVLLLGGIAKESEVLDLAVAHDIIHKSGAWFSYNDERLGQGRDNVKELLRSNPTLMAEVEEKVRAILNEKAKAELEKKEKKAVDAAIPAPVTAPAASKTKIKANLDITVDDDE